MVNEELEAAVRIVEALLGKATLVGGLELTQGRQSNAGDVGERVGELFKAVFKAVRERSRPDP